MISKLSKRDLIYIVSARVSGNLIPFDPACRLCASSASPPAKRSREQQTAKFRNTNKINFQGYELEKTIKRNV